MKSDPSTAAQKPALDKRAVIQAVIAEIARDLRGFVASAKAAHEEATHEQNKAENKYDTRALEASYLARGQSRQAAELEAAQQEYGALDLIKFLPTSPIDVGALIILEHGRGGQSYFLLGPKAGGMELTVEGVEITVITPQSPIGRQLMGKKRGESIVLPAGALRIVAVS